MSQTVTAWADNGADQFQAQLAAGEFAGALAAAEHIDRPPQRDAWLVQLATAQAKTGGFDAAFGTLARVDDDRTRYSAVQSTKEIKSQEGGRGGSQANFQPLMDLITNTVQPTTWDAMGGVGTISQFQNGVYVDAQGELKRAIQTQKSDGLVIARASAQKATTNNRDARRQSNQRKVSLTRLEKHLQLALAAGRQPSDDMLHLAGLEKIEYVLVYPETGDIVLAGPASGWYTDAEGRDVSRATGRPVLQLDDMVVMLRYLTSTPGATFGCSIDPTAEGLAKTKAFAEKSSANPIKPEQRSAWLKQLRDQMGRQSISVEGIDPRTRAARVLVEADYRMKLVGMGLEEGTHDVPSYLELVNVAKGQAPPALDVLRWWFTMNYDDLRATESRDAFELRGTGVKVLSENEMLTKLGHQIHTGQSSETNQEFANRFTRNFSALAQKYPVYADMQNIFDLALVAALVQSEGLANRVGWHMTCFSDPEQYQVTLGPAPTRVESVINHRIVNGKHILVGVSGGVAAQPWAFASASHIRTESNGQLQSERDRSSQRNLPLEAWWWD